MKREGDKIKRERWFWRMEFNADQPTTWTTWTTLAGLSLKAGHQGFTPATKRVAPSYFYWKIEQK